MAATKEPSPNDQRSTVKNPTSPQHEKDKANTEKQIKEQPKKGK